MMRTILTGISKIIANRAAAFLAIALLWFSITGLIVASDSSSPPKILDLENTRFTCMLNSTSGCEREPIGFRTIFVPGGPGFDSSYLISLIEQLKLPGSSWCCDLPGNGNYKLEGVFNFEDWKSRFPRAIASFKERVPGGPLLVVAHSFAGLLVFACPDLRHTVDAFIFLNSTPKNPATPVTEGGFIEAAETAIARRDALNKEAQEEAGKYLLPFAQGFCPELSAGEAEAFFKQITCSWQPLYWFEKTAPLRDEEGTWVPACPTLIVESSLDPFYGLFKKEGTKYAKPNVTFKAIEGAGHFCWIKGGAALKGTVYAFLDDSFYRKEVMER